MWHIYVAYPQSLSPQDAGIPPSPLPRGMRGGGATSDSLTLSIHICVCVCVCVEYMKGPFIYWPRRGGGVAVLFQPWLQLFSNDKKIFQF